MPFNPGNQDVSGQILASGISSFGKNLANRREKRNEQQDILKDAQGRGKSLGQTLKGLEEMGIVPSGSYDKMVQTQESMAPREFVGFVDQQAKQLNSLITGGVQMRQLQNNQAQQQQRLQAAMAEQQQKIQGQQAEEQDQERLAKAMALATDTDGNIIASDVVRGYLDMNGKDMKKLSEALASVEKVQQEQEKNVPKADFKASAYDVELPGGKKRSVLQTSTGAVQMIPEPGDTAVITNANAYAEKISKLRKFVDNGDIESAYWLAVELKMTGDFGMPITRDDIESRFSKAGGQSTKTTTPSETPQSPTVSNEELLNKYRPRK